MQRIKVVELGLGLGVAAFLGWSLLGLAFLLPLMELELEPGALGTRLLVAACQDVSLLVSMLLLGLLSGALITTGRWVIGSLAAGVALTFRLAVPWVTGDPDAPWLDWLGAGLHLVFVLSGIPLFAWAFGISRRFLDRRDAGRV
jgi:hypothetical protein